jgi:uncharacterized UBP type Zn finger protein
MASDGTGMALDVRAVSPNGSAPRCEHLDTLTPVPPRFSVCQVCHASGDRDGRDLVACMTCGWVACFDDSPRHHALAHYEETDHPLVQSLRPGRGWRWCHVHRRIV